jgi:hypothetical protein
MAASTTPINPPWKAHTAVPDGDNLYGMFEIVPQVCKLIKKDIPQTGTHHQSQRHIKNQILQHLPLKTQMPRAF